MDDKVFIQAMETIVSALKEKGYDPYSQLLGYVLEDEPLYITSHNGARDLIRQLDKNKIREYADRMNRR